MIPCLCDSWYSVAAIDATVGRYWTPHFKTEFDVGTAGEGRIYGPYREQNLRETTVGATALYQFFENQWVHPFIGGGVELAREHIRARIGGRRYRHLLAHRACRPGLIPPNGGTG